jgi:hypothetical protein
MMPPPGKVVTSKCSDVFEHRIAAKDFGNFVSHSGEEMMDVQRITSFFVMRDLFLFRLGWLELLNEFGFGSGIYIFRRWSLKRTESVLRKFLMARWDSDVWIMY